MWQYTSTVFGIDSDNNTDNWNKLSKLRTKKRKTKKHL